MLRHTLGDTGDQVLQLELLQVWAHTSNGVQQVLSGIVFVQSQRLGTPVELEADGNLFSFRYMEAWPFSA